MTAVPKQAVELVKRFEGCRLAAYPDPATGGAPWTCGWGTTGPTVSKGVVWDQATADAWLARDLERFAAGVDRVVEVPLTDNQRSALISFAYNCGLSNLKGSTLLRLVNAGRFTDAAEQFGRWNKAAGKVMGGLTNRRAAERDLFLTT